MVQRSSDEQRQKLFRRMQWVYVYTPPILVGVLGMLGGLVIAFLFPVEGLGFWARFAIGFVLIIGLPLAAYVIRERWNR